MLRRRVAAKPAVLPRPLDSNRLRKGRTPPYLVAAFFLRVRTAFRLAAGLLRYFPLPPYQARNRSSSASGKDSDTTTVPFGFVLIDRIFTGIGYHLRLEPCPAAPPF
jgi:hypothetical protein